MGLPLADGDCSSARTSASDESSGGNDASGLIIDGDGQFEGLYMVLEEKVPTKGRVIRDREEGCSRR